MPVAVPRYVQWLHRIQCLRRIAHNHEPTEHLNNLDHFHSRQSLIDSEEDQPMRVTYTLISYRMSIDDVCNLINYRS